MAGAELGDFPICFLYTSGRISGFRNKTKECRMIYTLLPTLRSSLHAYITIVLCICLALATMSKLTNSDGVWISFHIVQGLQGIFIAMLVTCNCQVLKLYTRSLKTRAIRHIPSYVGKPSTSGLNKSTSLQMLTWDPPPDI
ncbi:hypothetical protein D910_04071, partial [Dendroctonus ponderosae]